jgi:putative Mg2+ transporter-C (MgtC) family protein
MREGLSVRGLTTAASIWITAGIGILAGIGFYLPAVMTTVISLAALSGFRWIERHIKTESYAQLVVVFHRRSRAPTRTTSWRLAKQHGFNVSALNHRFQARGLGSWSTA